MNAVHVFVTVSVDQLRSQLASCNSAEDWLNVTRVCEAKLQTASAAQRYQQLSALYLQALQVVSFQRRIVVEYFNEFVRHIIVMVWQSVDLMSLMYKTTVYTLVNSIIMHQKQQI